ncbi:ShlB/FhaC/HecB family hemolysin secretion/activation protein [Flavobacterium tegetincola]|uniref:ShlB/FhaC/HecB family hemolysin secretion/activation protein n=1 Tax=Flavobacterium tegetincola TaxID=150172 RepID=UPI000479AD3E|nr:ShlB/FhaC/HecB family hemolysin secretion/activation protein [Flavobacterium tegetincola]
MKKLFLVCFLFVYQMHFGQALSLQIISEDTTEQAVIDSLGYQTKHGDVKRILDEVQKLTEVLVQKGYLENELLDSNKISDSLYQFKLKLGFRTKAVHIYVGGASKYLAFEKDTIVLPIDKTELFLQQQLNALELKGFSFATLKLVDFKKQDNALFAQLKVATNTIRTLDAIVINGYDNFPVAHKKNMQRLFSKKTFNKNALSTLYKEFNKFRFVNQTRYPEILFSEDSTKVYVYLEKAKSNKFDGYIGFANDENSKLTFTGYLDLALTNILNAGEEFNLYWKSDDNKQVTFNAGIEIPYIFKTPLGVRANLNIFRQDSTFQNTKTALDLGYYFTYNKKLFLGYQSTESSDIQNTNTALINDFESRFLTSTFEYKNYIDDPLFPEKTKFILKSGIGQRDSKLEISKQTFLDLNISHNLYLNKNNSIHLRTQSFYLQSTSYITSELYRFGGIQSIRGFNENSLQANSYVSLLTEYRFTVAPNLYLHSVLDYGYYQDQTTGTKNNLLGLGFGLGILSKNGILNLIYANGSTNDQAIQLANSIIHIKFITKF